MIQRKQTLYLLAALILTVVCLCLPIGTFNATGMGGDAVLYNLGMRDANGAFTFEHVSFFVLLVISCPLMLATIFLYSNRKLQAQLCYCTIVLHVAWYIYFAVSFYGEVFRQDTFSPNISFCSPAIALILQYMARRAILADEKLVRAADRIR
ncbi:MAG TPA: DUF4293 domain-containing protein [Prevotella sp.]